jgi:signal transduction histidine kinase
VAANHEQAAPCHRLRVEAAEPQLIGPWDTARLERVLEKLLCNATKYSPWGGQITGAVRREANPTGAWAVLAVQDRGMGIPRADFPHVFDRFHRARNAARVAAGTGLGLAVVKQVVKQHGGTAAVESTERAGSTFTVRLPLAGDYRVRRRQRAFARRLHLFGPRSHLAHASFPP